YGRRVRLDAATEVLPTFPLAVEPMVPKRAVRVSDEYVESVRPPRRNRRPAHRPWHVPVRRGITLWLPSLEGSIDPPRVPKLVIRADRKDIETAVSPGDDPRVRLQDPTERLPPPLPHSVDPPRVPQPGVTAACEYVETTRSP